MQPSPKPLLRSAELHGWANEAKFDLTGVARPEPIPADILMTWLESGHAADMDWMAARAEDRLDVRRVLPGAKTVLALVCNHYRAEADPSPIARYARGRDYHATLKDR